VAGWLRPVPLLAAYSRLMSHGLNHAPQSSGDSSPFSIQHKACKMPLRNFFTQMTNDATQKAKSAQAVKIYASRLSAVTPVSFWVLVR